MIHQYKLNGYNIVLDVFSGSVHITDDAAYDAIKYIDEGKTQEEAAGAPRGAAAFCYHRGFYL